MVQTMTERVARNRKGLLLLAVGWIAIAVPVYGQVLHADGPLPSFEVATIKPPGGGGQLHPPGTVPVVLIPGFVMTRGLVGDAFGVNKNLVFGGPDWIDKQGYRIEAKIPDDLFAEMQKMPPDQKAKEVELMQQSLLAERYKLKVHFEMREMPVYELVVAKDGLKITKDKDDDTMAEQIGGGMRQGSGVAMFMVRHLSLTELVARMQGLLVNRPVVDKTGIAGRFTFTLKIAPEGTLFDRGESANSMDNSSPSLFTAIQDFGLKLQPAKGPVEVVVIDSIERPSEN